jgi:protein-serine/threonine kinase
VYVAMRTGRNIWKMANEKDECFRDYVEDRKIGRGCFFIEDICHSRNREVIYRMLALDYRQRPLAAECLMTQWLQNIVCCRTANFDPQSE